MFSVQSQCTLVIVAGRAVKEPREVDISGVGAAPVGAAVVVWLKR